MMTETHNLPCVFIDKNLEMKDVVNTLINELLKTRAVNLTNVIYK